MARRTCRRRDMTERYNAGERWGFALNCAKIAENRKFNLSPHNFPDSLASPNKIKIEHTAKTRGATEAPSSIPCSGGPTLTHSRVLGKIPKFFI